MMAKIDDYIEALNIFKKYLHKSTYEYRNPLQGEHDVIYCLVEFSKVSTSNQKKLRVLGWEESDVGNFICYANY